MPVDECLTVLRYMAFMTSDVTGSRRDAKQANAKMRSMREQN